MEFLRPIGKVFKKKLGKLNSQEEDIKSRLSAENKTNEKIQEVEHSDGLVVDTPTSSEVTLPTTTLVSETTKKYMSEIWAYLMGGRVRKIGVCGMKGVGKTTIMKHVKNLLEKSTNNFDNVIWVAVSRKRAVIELQNDIARALNQDLSKYEDKTIRTRMLLEMLKEKKRYVLILDEMREAFSLEEVGIPEPTRSNGCKIVLTTQSRNVCQTMNFKVITVWFLTKEEGWNLFLDEGGRDVSNISNLELIVKLAVKKCFCLPLAIVAIASNMKGVNDIYEWNNTLNELRICINGAKDTKSMVYEQLKVLYARWCFLYCSLIPKDFEIPKRELIEYWIAEGLVDEMSSREAEYDRGHDVLNTLEDICLLDTLEDICLLEGTGYRSTVKMCDPVKKITINITRASAPFMLKVGVQLKELPNKQEWTEDLEKVSLMKNSISKIPLNLSPKCPRLSTLLLQRNPLKRISDSFFVHMSGLRVLDLSYTNIEILPNSISNLENLTTLLLKWCWHLRHVPSLAKLKELRTLDLRHTKIREVPHGIEMLVNLRCLNLYAEHLKTLPDGILPKLSHLQCLIVWWGSNTLKIKGEEVAGLSKLETFVSQLYSPQDFNTYVKSLQGRGPRIFHLQVGSSNPFINIDSCIDFEEEGRHFTKHVRLRNCNIRRSGKDPIVLPNNIEFLSIEECNDASSLCDVSSLRTDLLKYCEIRCCDGIECMIRSSDDYTPLQSLEVLLLIRLEQLRVLVKQEGRISPPPVVFSCLKELYISGCPNIKKLFTLGLPPHLQKLEVIDCEGMKEIIAAKAEGEEQGMGEIRNHSIVNNDDANIPITLPELRFLSLINLPGLNNIVYSKGIMVCDSLQEIFIHKCPELKRLPLSLPMHNGQPSPPPSLVRIIVDDQECWKLLRRDHPYAKDVLQPLVFNWWTMQPIG